MVHRTRAKTNSYQNKGLLLDYKADEAEKVFEKLSVHKICEANGVMFATLVNGLSKAGNTRAACRYLEIFAKTGYNADNVHACSTVIDSFNFQRTFLPTNLQEDLTLQETLSTNFPSKGLRPNVPTYTILIGLLYEKGLTEEAMHLLQEMEKSGCEPDRVTYNVMIKGFLKQNELCKASPIFEEMRRRGFSPDSSMASMLLDQVQEQEEDGVIF